MDRLDRYQPQALFERAHILIALGRDEEALKVCGRLGKSILQQHSEEEVQNRNIYIVFVVTTAPVLLLLLLLREWVRVKLMNGIYTPALTISLPFPFVIYYMLPNAAIWSLEFS